MNLKLIFVISDYYSNNTEAELENVLTYFIQKSITNFKYRSPTKRTADYDINTHEYINSNPEKFIKLDDEDKLIYIQ